MATEKITRESHPFLTKVALIAFPSYHGRKFRLNVTDRPIFMADTYWDGGSRSQYVFVNFQTQQIMSLGDPISGGFAPNARAAHDALSSVELPAGVVCVRHSIFCGKDTGLTVYIRPTVLAELQPVSLTA